MLAHVFAHRGEQVGVFGKALHQDLARTIERGLGVGHTGVVDAIGVAEGLLQVLGGFVVGHQHGIGEQRVGQRLQAGFARDLRLGAALELVGQVEVFEPRLVFSTFDGGAQLGGHLVLLFDAGDHRGAAFLQFAQVVQALFEIAQLGVVERAGDFLAVARNEGHGGALIEQLDGGGDLGQAHAQFGGDALFDGGQRHSLYDLTWK